jgi:hypothetical protein
VLAIAACSYRSFQLWLLKAKIEAAICGGQTFLGED